MFPIARAFTSSVGVSSSVTRRGIWNPFRRPFSNLVNLRPAPCSRREEFSTVTIDDVSSFAAALLPKPADSQYSFTLGEQAQNKSAVYQKKKPSGDFDSFVDTGHGIISSDSGKCGKVIVLCEKLAQEVNEHEALRDHPAVVIDVGDPSDDEPSPFALDQLRQYLGSPPIVVEPRTTGQLSRVLRHCNGSSYEECGNTGESENGEEAKDDGFMNKKNRRRIAVVPQGGNTSLSGGSVPVHDEIVLSLRKLEKSLLEVDTSSMIALCGAGIVLADLDEFLAGHSLISPIDLGAKGSCVIGGNIATNAGGLRVVRYGSLHANVVGLEAVLPDGRVLDLIRSPVRKDNTGYDLKQILVGSEGTLAVVSKVALAVHPRPKSVNVAVLSLDSFGSVVKLLESARNSLGEILSAFEFMDRAAIRAYSDAHRRSEEESDHSVVKVIPEESIDEPFHVLIETSGCNPSHDEEKLTLFLESMLEGGIVTNGAVAQDGAQAEKMWALREGISESCSKYGALYKYDLSVPVAKSAELADAVKARLGVDGRNEILPGAEDRGCKVITFGHLGDGNVHLNIAAREQGEQVVDAIEPFVYEWAAKMSGSVSAEHGIGLQKRKALKAAKCPVSMEIMKSIKDAFDPQGILNPYKVFLEEDEKDYGADIW